jgi:LysM repeat protein
VDLTKPQDVGAGTSVTVGKAVTLASGTAGQPITLTTTATPNVSVRLPDATTVLAPAGWDGKINPPTVGTSAGTPPSGFSVGGTVIEVGSSTAVLLFDRPATIVLTGVSGPVGYRPSGSDQWVTIDPCGAGGASFPGACSSFDPVTNTTTITTYHFTAFGSLTAARGTALPVQQTIAATATGISCFAYSGPTTSVAAFTTFFSATVAGINQFMVPAGTYSSWFRAAPSFATMTSLAEGDVICIDGPAGSNVFVSGAAGGSTPPASPPATPAAVTTNTTLTGIYCFTYAGPATAVADFTTRFNSAIEAVNRLNFPDGKFSSWFAAAPSFSTITSLNSGDVICVAAAAGTSVFDTSRNTQPSPAPAITSLNVSTGPAAGGTAVVITGTGFTGATGVTFGGTPARAFSVVNSTTINATTPAGSGSVAVVVLHAAGNATRAAGFTYQSASATTIYVVQAGDTLTGIATRFNTTVAVLSQLNGITDPSLIQIGQTLIVPVA